MTRIDAFLKNVGIFKSRSQAKRCCNEGRVQIASQSVRASYGVRIGDLLSVETATQRLELEVLETPERPVARARRDQCVRLVERQPLTQEVLGFDDDA